MDDADRLDRFFGDPTVPQAEKDAVASMLRGRTVTQDKRTFAQRGEDYITGKANEIAVAGQNLLGDIVGNQSPTPRTWGNTAQDVLTVGAPIAAVSDPTGTAARLYAGANLAGAGLYGAGASQSQADLANAGIQIGGGLAQAGMQGYQALSGAKATMSAKYKAIKDAAQNIPLDLNSDVAQNLRDQLQRGLKFYGTGTSERKIATDLLARLKPARLTNPLYGGPATWGDLDEAYFGLQGLKKTSFIRGAIQDAKSAMLEGTPVGSAYQAANARWAKLMGKPIISGRAALMGGGAAALAGVHEAYEGHPGRAAAIVGGTLLGGYAPAALASGAAATAGPLARTAIMGGAALQSMGTAAPETSDEEPSAPEEAAPEPAPEQANPQQFQAQPQSPPYLGRYARDINAAATLARIPPRLLGNAVIPQESSGNVNALSNGGWAGTPANGIMQIVPGTFEIVRKPVEEALGRRADVDNPLDNLLGGAFLWRRYLDMAGGDVRKAAFLYHGGENPSTWGPRTLQYGADIAQRFAQGAPQSPVAAAPQTGTPGTFLDQSGNVVQDPNFHYSPGFGPDQNTGG